MDGYLEASFPSSHTLMSICICGSSVIVNNKLFRNKLTKIINISLYVLAIIIVLGRLISGVHWLTDILGGIIISFAFLMSFYSIIEAIHKKENQ